LMQRFVPQLRIDGPGRETKLTRLLIRSASGGVR
jgi:hypothetical protein